MGESPGVVGSSGAPTASVVLLPPLDESCTHFELVLAALPEAVGAHVQVVAVDRPRVATDVNQRANPVAVRGFVDDLADLDERLRRVPTPLVLLGASYGGLLARAFAARHGDRVGGLVLVDAVHEDVYDGVRAAVGPDAATVLANQEGLDLVSTFAQARRLLAWTTLGDLPVVALARDGLHEHERAVDPRVADLDRVWREHQELLAGCSSRAHVRVVPRAGHFIARERPEAVVAALAEVLAALPAA